MFKGKEKEYNEPVLNRTNEKGEITKVSLAFLMEDVGLEIDATYNKYNPLFEGQTCDTNEKGFIKSLRGIKERLDVITAESKIIEGIKTDDVQDVFG